MQARGRGVRLLACSCLMPDAMGWCSSAACEKGQVKLGARLIAALVLILDVSLLSRFEKVM
jgi:hypothetical protein